VPFELAERIACEDHATLWAKTIALAARNGVEVLHAAGGFTDRQAPALNRRLRDHAYEVLIALRRMDPRRGDDPFSAYLIDLIDDQEEDWLRAALKGAVTNAVREFADAERSTPRRQLGSSRQRSMVRSRSSRCTTGSISPKRDGGWRL
jgi:hypothetical protein